MPWLLLIFIFLFLLAIIIPWVSLAPWVPAKKTDIKRIGGLADLKPNETFYDLGCGDGKVVFGLAKNSQARFIGIELSFLFYFICLFKKILLNCKNCGFKLKNIYREDLGRADVVYVFAASREKLKNKLKNKLQNELKPGARVISYVFPIEGWTPAQISKPQEKDITIYLYKF